MSAFHFLLLLSSFTSLSANSCNLSVRLLQELHNEGFHRNLTYKVTFQDISRTGLFEGCYIGLDQMLPAGVYASPDELGDLMRTKKLTAIPKNRVNIELPAEESQPSSVFVIGTVKHGEVDLWLPVHARYHRAAENGGLHYNMIEQPSVYLRCDHPALDSCDLGQQITFLCNGFGKDTCLWEKIPVDVVSPRVQLQVPVGSLQHYGVVAPATAAAVVVCSLYLLKTIHDYKLLKLATKTK